MIERDFDVTFIANLALREKQIQQNYRPIIAVHKWFARRPGTLFRGLLLSEFVPAPLRDSFYRPHKLPGIHIADPFMGGGTPLLEANRLGCAVHGCDINPMAYWIVKQELEHLDLKAYQKAAYALRQQLSQKLGCLYQTECQKCGIKDASVKYFLWVKVQECRNCKKRFDLFPGYLVSENKRHPKNVFVCAKCGELTECENAKNPGKCASCKATLANIGPARRGHCPCSHCGAANRFPDFGCGPPSHRMFAIEYNCEKCKPGQQGRFFKKPSPSDLKKYEEAEGVCRRMKAQFVPDEEIPSGDETNRLHRWGYTRYREMFNARQLIGLEFSCRLITAQKDERIRSALATNLSDLLRYQNMLCRYDTMALKSLDIFSVHGFPVGLVHCESNLLGIFRPYTNVSVGSGGWSNIVEKFYKAKSYCDDPFEIRHDGLRKTVVPVDGEWIGDQRNGDRSPEKRIVDLQCKNATYLDLEDSSLDAVFTDPPYFGNVQYAELIDFCYVWLRKLARTCGSAFEKVSTRDSSELTGNEDMGRGLEHFTDGLSSVFQRMSRALKPGAPLAFTFHHNSISAYLPIAAAILDANLVCSASIPCPAEMGASIHINGTGSSIIDTVFVCRSTGRIPKKWIVESFGSVKRLIAEDVEKLKRAEVNPTAGDVRCILFGHLTRLAVWFLRNKWDRELPAAKRMDLINEWLKEFGGVDAIMRSLDKILAGAPRRQQWVAMESPEPYGKRCHEISF